MTDLNPPAFLLLKPPVMKQPVPLLKMDARFFPQLSLRKWKSMRATAVCIQKWLHVSMS
jgi:hypothetical protein